jgi:hypothetical protein
MAVFHSVKLHVLLPAQTNPLMSQPGHVTRPENRSECPVVLDLAGNDFFNIYIFPIDFLF